MVDFWTGTLVFIAEENSCQFPPCFHLLIINLWLFLFLSESFCVYLRGLTHCKYPLQATDYCVFFQLPWLYFLLCCFLKECHYNLPVPLSHCIHFDDETFLLVAFKMPSGTVASFLPWWAEPLTASHLFPMHLLLSPHLVQSKTVFLWPSPSTIFNATTFQFLPLAIRSLYQIHSSFVSAFQGISFFLTP